MDSGSKYILKWQEHEKAYPWEFDAGLLLEIAGESAKEAAQQLLEGCNNMTTLGWKIMLDASNYLYENYHLKTAEKYQTLYRNLVLMNDRREKTAKIILELKNNQAIPS